MSEDEQRRRFERLALPHLGAAYNLARWLTRNDHDAQDVVQEAFLRALRYIGTLRGDDGRAWLLQVVRHTCWTWLEANRPGELAALDSDDGDGLAAPASEEPPARAQRKAERAQIDGAIAALPCLLREVLVLRELEELSYAEIARIADIPIGTVMARLSRARERMRASLAAPPRAQLRQVGGAAPQPRQGGQK